MAKLKPKHLFELAFVSDPALSPDGTRAAAVHTKIVQPDEDKPPRYMSNIYLYDLETGQKTQFTRSEFSDTHPRFSPDGERLAFLSKREEEGKAQLYIMNVTGGEAEQLTDFKSGVSSFVWHPKGQSLAFVSRGDWVDTVAKNKTARTIERLHYKMNGVGFRPLEPAQVYLYNLKKGETDKLTYLKSDPSGLAFSRDGKTLYFVASASVEDGDEWCSDLYALTLKSGKLKKLLPAPGNIAAPSPSPDGRHVAFFAPVDWDVFASANVPWLVDAKGGEPELLGDMETPPSIGGDSRYGNYPNAAKWQSADTLLLNVNRAGRSGLASLDPKTRDLTPLVEGDRAVTSFDAGGETLLYTAETPHQPGELFVSQAGEERKLSAANDAFVKRFKLTTASEPVLLETSVDTTLSYWTLEPAKPRKDGATVLQVHGGPHTNYGYGFYLEFQVLAAAGYRVVYGNPRGSSGYGSDYATTLLTRYGTIDADDVLAMARHATADRPDAPVHLTGGSYGGFMTNWLVSHTDMFRSAVTQRSISNWLSFYGTADIGYRFTEVEQGGNPWEDTTALWEQSPIKYVANVSTPLLILHADEDHRCPVEQAEQFYVALKRIGKAPTRFIRFPGESHELSRSGRPDRRVERLEAILDWFKEYA